MSADPTVAITGVTISGNMGGQAMLYATLGQLRKRLPRSKAVLFSVYPEADRRHPTEHQVRIVNSSPARLLLVYVPIMLLLWPLRRSAAVRRALRPLGYFRALFACDLLLDHSGIAFVDNRGVPLLLYNLACALPGFFAQIPVIKLSQALGPFEQPLNRCVARWTLSKCRKVIARGRITAEYLQALGLADTPVYPDVAFTLEVREADRAFADEQLRALGPGEAPVIISPSRVVERLRRRFSIDYAQELEAFITTLLARGERVLLLPHSMGSGGDKNNDIALCRKLHAAVRHRNVHLLEDVSDCRRLRALIGRGKCFVGNRFHALVSALVEGVPFIAIGWSHKYMEMMEPFEMDGWALDHEEFSTQRLVELFDQLLGQLDAVRAKLRARRAAVVALAERNYDALA